MNKVGVVILVLMFFASSIAIATPTENLVENGTFDTDMDDWNLATSTNFTIGVNNSHAEFNTTHTDYLWDYGYGNFTDYTLYNMTLHHGDPSEDAFNSSYGWETNGYIELNNETAVLMNETFNNINNWTYQENPSTSAFVQSNIDTTFNVTPLNALAIESKKLMNETEVSEDFSSDVGDAYWQGEGSSKFIYNSTGQYVDAQFSSAGSMDTHFARLLWNVTEKDENNKFGYSVLVQRNETGSHDALSRITIGFVNKSDTTNGINSLLAQIEVGASEFAYGLGGVFFDDTGQKKNSGGISSISLADMRWGLIINLTYDSDKLVVTAQNRTTWASEGSQSIDTSTGSGFTVDAIAICNDDWQVRNPERLYDAHVDDLTAWMETDNRPQYVMATLTNETVSVTNKSIVTFSGYRKHYHDAQMGLQRSSIRFNNGTSDWYESTTNYSTTSDSAWRHDNGAELNIPLDAGQSLETRVWSYQTISEGSNDYPAKALYMDDFQVNATSYVWNGSMMSDVIDRGYFADWLQFSMVIFSPTYYGDIYTPDEMYDRITVSVQTRVGDTPTVDAFWSGWSSVSGFSFLDYITIPPSVLPLGDSYEYQGNIQSTNGRYIQYKAEFTVMDRDYTPKFLFSELSSVPINVREEWGSMKQDITKAYSMFTILKYDYKIDHLNNSDKGNITVSFGGTEINRINWTFNETDWISEKHYLPTSFNASGTFTLNFTVEARFNSTNGSCSFWFDNVEVLIEKQTPTITSFNIANETRIEFNGTFQDLTRGSDYDYLGLDGIDSVNISVGVFDLEVTDITYLGDGNFSFRYTWAETPFEISEGTILDATVRVTDTASLYDEATDSLRIPTAVDFMIALLSLGLMMMIIMLIFQRHLLTAWDTAKGKDERLLPDSITGKDR